jgi:hypothetical protein
MQSNLAEIEPDEENVPNSQTEEPAKTGNVYSIETRQTLSPEELEKAREEERHRTWPVTIGSKGNVVGLPPHLTEHDVVLFKDSDGGWKAQNPSPELLEEIKMWRTDWMKPPTRP